MNLLPGIPTSSPPPIRSAPPRAAQTYVNPAQLAETKSTTPAKMGESTNTLPGQELSRDAFLQLLVLQLRNQDPLDPQSNQDMLAQLAQFSALEQMNNLNTSFEQLGGNIDQLNFINASELLGRRVSGVDFNGQPRQGVVESVHLDGSVVVLRVDGEFMSMAGILQIDVPAPADPAE